MQLEPGGELLRLAAGYVADPELSFDEYDLGVTRQRSIPGAVPLGPVTVSYGNTLFEIIHALGAAIKQLRARLEE